MTILEAMENALALLEASGFKAGGDVHDDLELAINRMKMKHRKASEEQL